MRLWFSSLQGAIALSVTALLSFVAYAFLVSRYVLEQLTPGMVAASVETLVVVAIAGGWTWGLLAAARGSRSGLIAALAFTLLPALFTLYDLVFNSPIPFGWPLLQGVVWVTFGLCMIAIAAVSLRLRRGTPTG
ncbi:MAG: hypothetical protein GTO63_18760 [Anaerolineae bacterium]|nr:hypothetical protein [Anaerolineae bacterium]NIN96812.1 hypothetical protein [Anaerolineae bacterium]